MPFLRCGRFGMVGLRRACFCIVWMVASGGAGKACCDGDVCGDVMTGVERMGLAGKERRVKASRGAEWHVAAGWDRFG